jgi:competence protein ComFB
MALLKGRVRMTLVNVTETLVHMVFNNEFVKRKLACPCDQCVNDVLALTLNNLQPRYVSTDKGEAYVKVQYFNPQIRSDILRELTLSADQVNAKPHHALSGQ